MTREDLETLVSEATGRTDKTTLIRSALNLAVSEVSTQKQWSDLLARDEVTIASGAQSVELADNVARMFQVTVVDGTLSRPLIGRSKSYVEERYPSPESWPVGKPTYGYLEGRTLYMVPRPDQAYVIRYSYYKLHPDLDDPTSEVLIRHAGAAIAAYATFWVFQSIEKLKEAEQWYATYLRQLAAAKKLDSDSFTKYQAIPRANVGRVGKYRYPDWTDPFVRTMP